MATLTSDRIHIMSSRREDAAEALASVRLEGLDPGEAEPILRRWAAGELTDAQLDEAYACFLANEPVDHLLAPAPVHP